MTAYRLYTLDEQKGISLADWIQADTDEGAIQQAKAIEHGRHLCEVWQGNRLVATLKSDELSG